MVCVHANAIPMSGGEGQCIYTEARARLTTDQGVIVRPHVLPRSDTSHSFAQLVYR
jgi:hypothetical protein